MSKYREIVDKIAKEYSLPPALFRALITQESGWNPSARSPAGAYGFTQLMPGTARELGVNPYDPIDNLRGGARYLRKMLNKFGNVQLALAAYNAGPGAVTKYGGIPPYRETQNYVKRIMRMYKGGGDDIPPAVVKEQKNRIFKHTPQLVKMPMLKLKIEMIGDV